jgi:hypothetical protein
MHLVVAATGRHLRNGSCMPDATASMAATSSSTASTVPSRSSRACSFQEIETPSRHAKAAQLLWPLLLLQTTDRIPCGCDEREEGNAGRGPGSTRRRAARPLPFGAHALVIARTTWPGQFPMTLAAFCPDGCIRVAIHPRRVISPGPDAEHIRVVGPEQRGSRVRMPSL